MSVKLGTVQVIVVGSLDIFAPGGAAKRTRQLASLFDRAGYNVRLIGFSGSERRTADGLYDSVDVDIVGAVKGRSYRRAISLFGKGAVWSDVRLLGARVEESLVSERNVSSIVLYNQDPTLAREIARISRRHGAKFVQQFAELHQAGDYRFRWLSGYWIREQIHVRTVPRLASAYIAITSTLHSVVKKNGGRNGVVIPSLVDCGHWGNLLAKSAPVENGGRVLYVGEGARRDCLDLALQAFKIYRGNGGNCKFRCVGLKKQTKEHIMRTARELGMASYVELCGPVTPDELVVEYNHARALLLLRTDDQSTRCCFPTRLGEMLLTEKPVILSEVPDFDRYFVDGVNAIMTKPSDPESIARGFVRATESCELGASVGKEGKRVAISKFSIESQKEGLRRWYESWINESVDD